MNIHPESLMWLVPAVYLLASLGILLVQGQAWRIAHATGLITAGIALIAGIWTGAHMLKASGTADAIGAVMLLLITLLGWVIVRYSRNYLTGESGQLRYVVALLFTLAAVAAVVLTDHLGMLLLAWFASSLGLHHLLTFYRERPQAQIVAHKKFLASRMAECCLLVAIALVYGETGTLSFNGINEYVQYVGSLPLTLHAAAVLIALAVALKSAQLPLHGWLIQVMEAPTPVSALLHAGIVNIGGFVLIRLAELVSAAPVAQALLVIIGTLTAVLAGLVMMTRISIKVRLAWSTCAQMGFMLMECGLGLYELAFLHLIAHSLYKAYAFLSAGDTVLETRQYEIVRGGRINDTGALLWQRISAFPLALSLVGGSVFVWQQWLTDVHIAPVALLIVAFGLSPLLWTQLGGRALLRPILHVVALTQLYVVWHIGFSALIPVTAAASPVLVGFAGACFALLYLMQIWLLAWPRGQLSSSLYPWAYAGFYLDERFTRLTFRIWPAQMDMASYATTPSHPIATGENA